MSQTGEWTRSQKIAWEFTLLGVGQGINATQALKQYRSGGGRIRDSSWYSLYKDAFSLYGHRESIVKIPMTYTVPETMSSEEDIAWRSRYVMQMKLYGVDTETGEHISQYVTAESDVLLTKKEWIDSAADAITGLDWTRPIVVDYAREFTFYKRPERYG